MSPGRHAKQGQFIIFRLVPSDSNKPLRVFLSEGMAWTHHQASARKGAFSTMKALLSKVKLKYPDVILEECRD